MIDTHDSVIKLGQIFSDNKLPPSSYPLKSPALNKSIKEVGIITPLLVQLISGDKYRVICGHRRLFACQELGIENVPCRVLNEALDDFQIFLLNLNDNLSSRVFNPIEQSIIINVFLGFLPEDKLITDYLPLLGLNPHPNIKKKLAPLASLEESIKQAVVDENLHPDTAYSLSCLNAAERLAIFAVFEKAHLSTSKQQELINNLEALKHRDDTSIEELLCEPVISEIIQNEELSANQRAEQIRHFFQQKRSPLLSRAQQDFILYKKELALPPNIQLTPPPFFERDDYKVSFSFKNAAQLKSKLAKLEEITDSETLQKIMKLGKEL